MRLAFVRSLAAGLVAAGLAAAGVAAAVLHTAEPARADEPRVALDLLAVYELALANDPTMLAARHTLDAAREARPLALADLLPSVAATAVYGTERSEITRSGDAGNEETRVTTTEPYDYGIDLSQPLFDAEALATWRRAGDEVAAAELDFAAAREALVVRTATAYFEALAALDDLRFLTAEGDALARQLERAEGRFRAGVAARTDVEEARAARDLTRAARVEAKRRAAISRRALDEITGPLDAPLAPLAAATPFARPDPDDPDAWVAAALEANVALAAARRRLAIADDDVDVARAGHLPSISLEGSQRFGETSGFNQGEFDRRSLGVAVEVPLFEGLGTQAQVRRSASLREARRAELEAVRRAVERFARDAFLGVTSGIARVEALRQAVASNRSALEAAEAGLRVGTRTTVDVLDRQRLLFQAESDLARARYDVVLERLRLERAAGDLDRADLERLRPTFRGDTPPDA